MPKKITLTDKDREELVPLLHITESERALLSEEVQAKLELFAKEVDERGFKELENIVEESIHSLKTLELSNTLTPKLTRSHKKEYLWWAMNYRFFLAQRKAQRARRKSKKSKKHK